MTEPSHLIGGCLCGAVRYLVDAPAGPTTLCHCEDCRRASGAPMAAWTFFRPGSLIWTKGEPKWVRFAGRERAFCGDCGSPLVFVDPGIPDWFEINTCSFDDPASLPPADECWLDDRLPWTARLAGLPGYPRSAPLPDT